MMMPTRVLKSKSSLLLLLSVCCCLRASWAQDVAGQDAQTVPEDLVVEDGYDNGFNDSAVAAVWHKDTLYVAITTEGGLVSNSNGGTDLIVRSFEAELVTKAAAVQYGGDGDDIVTAIAAPPSENLNDIVIVGSTVSTDDHLFPDFQDEATGLMDWFIAVLDTDLEITAAYVNGTEDNDQEATAVAVTEDGDYVVAGWTWGTYIEENAGADNDADSVGYDTWVIKTDSELSGDILWSVQFGTIAYDVPSKVIIGEDGEVYVIGTTTDSSDVLTDAEEEDFQSMYVYCLDGDDGDVLWSVTTELGVMTDASQAHGAVFKTKGTNELYISGNTQGIIPGFDGDSTGSDELFVVSLDPEDEGATNWVWQSEADATAFGTGGVVLADDEKSPIVSGIAFGNQFNLSFTYWEGGNGDMVAAQIDPDELIVEKYFVAAADNNETREDPFAMVKVDDVEFGVYLIGATNGEWLDEDSDPEETTNYLLLQVELEDLPEEDDDDDDGQDFPYWYIAVPLFAFGGVLFVVAYKWAAASQAAKAKRATMV